jgi:RNA polymerase sigma-70 factor (ECF subfamily)
VTPSDRFHDTVGAARSGDRTAYDQLFTRNLPALVAYLRAKVGGALAERESVNDLAQSVCREVLRDLPELEFGGEEQFRAYLFLQASRKVVDRYRYHKQEMRDPARQEPLPTESEAAAVLGAFAPLASPSRVAGAKEELSIVEQALQQLPDAQRDAVLLSRIAGLSYEEIARQKSISESAVRGLVARGLARLAGLLGRPAAGGAPAEGRQPP